MNLNGAILKGILLLSLDGIEHRPSGIYQSGLALVGLPGLIGQFRTFGKSRFDHGRDYIRCSHDSLRQVFKYIFHHMIIWM